MVIALGLYGLFGFQNQLNNFAVGLTFGVCHGLSVDVHRGLNAGMGRISSFWTVVGAPVSSSQER